MTLPGTVSGKPIGFKTLQEITGYVSVHDGYVLKAMVNLGKIIKTDQKDASGMPIYSVTHSMSFAVLTREEYEAMTKRDIQE